MTARAATKLLEKSISEGVRLTSSEKGPYPLKTENDLTYIDAAKQLKVNPSAYTLVVYNALQRAYSDPDQRDKEEIEVAVSVNMRKKRLVVVKIPRSSMGYKRNTGKRASTLLP